MALYLSLFRRFIVALPLLVGFLLAMPNTSWADGLPQLAKPKGEACIRPVEWMRRNHMDFLEHRRAETVREGMRIRSESLNNCATCHTSREQFCDRCHTYAGVAPNCFECHGYPQ